jgi:ABC-type lipoprotein release transport system permease subunit
MDRLALLSRLAWRNLWRHRRRTFIILFALALGIWSMVTLGALTRGSLEQQLEKAIANLTGHVQIQRPGYRDDPVIEHRYVITEELRGALDALPKTAWAARVRVPAVIASERESAGVTLVGIDPAAERGVSFISRAITDGRYLESTDDTGLLLGRKLAARLETGLGRRVVLMTQDVDNSIADRGFRVVGIFDGEPEAMETGYVFVGRGTAQALLRLDAQVSQVAVMTPDRNQVQETVDRLRAHAAGLEVQPWTVVEPLLRLTENVTNAILLIWYLIVFAAISFGLVNTLLMAVYERTREFGLVQALGMKPSRILGQVMIESLILLALALIAGNLLAGINLYWLRDGLDLRVFAEGFELIGVSPVIVPKLAPNDVLTANGLVFVLGLAASLYPAWRAARRVPVEAITRA